MHKDIEIIFFLRRTRFEEYGVKKQTKQKKIPPTIQQGKC